MRLITHFGNTKTVLRYPFMSKCVKKSRFFIGVTTCVLRLNFSVKR